jgi:hypothetical protein
MSFLPIRKIEVPVSDRQPDSGSLLIAVQKEVWPFLKQVRKVVNWAVDWLGLVAVDATDTPGTLEMKAQPGVGVTITKTGTPGTRTLVFAANASEITNIVNVTNITESTTSGSTLFPCDIPDSLLRQACVGIMYEGAAWASIFTAIAGISTWRSVYAGPLLIDGAGAMAPATVARDGDRLFVFEGTAHDGIYEVVDCGIHNTDGSIWDGSGGSSSTKPVIRRAIDANVPASLCHNMAVQIVKRTVLATHNGDYFTLTTADPIVVDTTALTFTYSGTRTSGAGSFLLTPSQVGTSGADSLTFDAGVAASSGGGPPNDVAFFADGSFVTLTGTPGGSTIPKGKWQAPCRLYVTSPDLANPPRVDFKFRVKHVDNSVDADFLTISSPPITTSIPTLYTPEANLAADVTIAPTDRIEYRIFGHANGAITQDIHIVWQNASRDTRIITTLSMGGFGTGVHNDLTGRESPNAHAFVCSVSEAGGLIPTITAPTVVVTPSSSGATMNGISTTGLNTGVKLSLVFKLPCIIANQASPGAGYAPFYTFNMMGTLQSPSIEQANGRVEVQYFATELSESPCFVINAGPLS